MDRSIPTLAKGLSDQALLSELARMKVLFQARAIAAVIGAPVLPDPFADRGFEEGVKS